MRNVLCAVLLALLPHAAAQAQESASFRLSEQVLNGGGNPTQGTVLASGSYRVRLDAIGDAVAGTGLASAAYRLDAGFVAPYLPPGEVQNFLMTTDAETLTWDPERSAGSYDVYRGLLSGLGALGYGACLLQEVTAPAAMDAEVPPAGEGWFYLVTVENRLGEEGTKGYASSGAERAGTQCP